jgi:hypothetical protein
VIRVTLRESPDGLGRRQHLDFDAAILKGLERVRIGPATAKKFCRPRFATDATSRVLCEIRQHPGEGFAPHHRWEVGVSVSPTLGVTRWGGQDSNLRPTDYEFVARAGATCGFDHERASNQHFLCPTARRISGGFPVRRGADAGRIIAVPSGFIADGLARPQVRYPEIPVVFAGSRKFAEEWTYRFLAAAFSDAENGCPVAERR